MLINDFIVTYRNTQCVNAIALSLSLFLVLFFFSSILVLSLAHPPCLSLPICLFGLLWFCSSLSQAGESNGLFKKTITKLSTEYRLQFVWPNVRRIKGADSSVTTTARAAAGDYPRKSISLGAIRSGQSGQPMHGHRDTHQYQYQTMGAGLPTVHKKRTTNQKEGATAICRR